MKPIGEHGVRLEGFGEIDAAIAALQFLGSLASFPERSRTPVNNLALVLDDFRRDALENPDIIRLQEEFAPEGHVRMTTLDLDGKFDTMMVRRSVEIASTHHPDELIRTTATDMVHGYEQAVFDGGMGSGQNQV